MNISINTYNLWREVPLKKENIPIITAYLPEKTASDVAVVVFAGGGYWGRAEHEGKGYAEFFAEHGIPAFVVDYRCRDDKFPAPLLDARRGVQFVRYYAEKFGINKNKIAVIGSSAGGHLAALLSTYRDPIDTVETDEIDKENYLPDAQILCYPVIELYPPYYHRDSAYNFLGESQIKRAKELSPNLLADEHTPPAFIWHTAADSCVSVMNSVDYFSALKKCGVSAELHIFPKGEHGLGLCNNDSDGEKHAGEWKNLVLRWIKNIF